MKLSWTESAQAFLSADVFNCRQTRARGGVLTDDTETCTVHDSCDLLSSLSGHIVVSSFVCALGDLRFICVTAFMAQENESPEFHPSCSEEPALGLSTGPSRRPDPSRGRWQKSSVAGQCMCGPRVGRQGRRSSFTEFHQDRFESTRHLDNMSHATHLPCVHTIFRERERETCQWKEHAQHHPPSPSRWRTSSNTGASTCAAETTPGHKRCGVWSVRSSESSHVRVGVLYQLLRALQHMTSHHTAVLKHTTI